MTMIMDLIDDDNGLNLQLASWYFSGTMKKYGIKCLA